MFVLFCFVLFSFLPVVVVVCVIIRVPPSSGFVRFVSEHYRAIETFFADRPEASAP